MLGKAFLSKSRIVALTDCVNAIIFQLERFTSPLVYLVCVCRRFAGVAGIRVEGSAWKDKQTRFPSDSAKKFSRDYTLCEN